jgi:hypothetical protein
MSFANAEGRASSLLTRELWAPKRIWDHEDRCMWKCRKMIQGHEYTWPFARTATTDPCGTPSQNSGLFLLSLKGGVTVTFLSSHVTGSNDVILNEVGRTTAVSVVGTHHGQGMRWDTALGQLLVVPLGNDSPEVWFCMTSRGWRLSSHKG